MSSVAKQISASTCLKTGMGKLRRIVVSSTSTGTYAVYDNAVGDNSGELKVNTVTPAAGSYINFGDLTFTKGLSIVIANTLQITVVFE